MQQAETLDRIVPIIGGSDVLNCSRISIAVQTGQGYFAACPQKGAVEAVVERSGQSERLREGDILYLPPGSACRLRSQGISSAELACVHFKLNPFHVPGQPDSRDIILQAGYSVPTVVRMDGRMDALECMLELVESGRADKPFSTLQQKAALLRLIVLVLQRLDEFNHEQPNKYSQDLHRAAAHIQEHYPEKITNETLARISRLSLSHFNKLFREKYGVSPMRYLSQCRMAAAKSLLASSPISLCKIAEKIGYESVHSFSKAFKKLESVSPGEYRVYHNHQPTAVRSCSASQ